MVHQTDFGILKTQEDVIIRISSLEAELNLLKDELNFNDKFRFIIFGGTALLIYTGFRVTSDIDCYYLNTISIAEVESIINSYGVNNRMEGMMTAPVFEDFYKRSKVLLNTECLEVRIASKEDLILSKLFSTRGSSQDEIDLIESGIFDDQNIDLKYITGIYNEFKDVRIGSKVNFSSLDDILEKIRDHKTKVR